MRCLICLTAMALLAAAGNAAGVFVSPQGNDKASGASDAPFRTLERARDEVRALNRTDATTITVTIGAGTYFFDRPFALNAADSATTGSRIVYAAAPGEAVVFSGGVSLNADAFAPVKDPYALQRMQREARPHVLEADVSALIPANYRLPVKYADVPETPELFFNEERMQLARWPNEGWTTITKIVATGSVPRAGDKGTSVGTFQYAGDRPARWNVDGGVWLHGYWCFDWYAEAIKVRAIDKEKREITLAAPAHYGIKAGNPSPRRFYAFNLLEELDRPGEYVIEPGGRLYFWPPADTGAARVTLSKLKEALVAMKDVSRVTLRGVVIEAGIGNGIEVGGGREVSIESCEVRNVQRTGIHMDGGARHRVDSCNVHDTGTGGIHLSGGDRKTLTPGGHEALNNRISRFSQHKLTYSSGIFLDGVGNRAAHNLIHDAPHMAVGIGGNDHVFELNEVRDVCTATDDAGAFYKGRNPSCRGNVIRFNFWKDIGSALGHGTAAVYFDDGDGGETVYGNIFLRCGHPGKGSFGTVFSHGGHDILAENNIFIDCKRALGSAPWNDTRWKNFLVEFKNKLLVEVDVTKPPYTTRYPELAGFMDPQPGAPRVNRANRNVFVNCGEVSKGKWEVSAGENWTTAEDPGFVDASKEDFRLKPDAKIFNHLPGFEPIPFEKIGPDE